MALAQQAGLGRLATVVTILVGMFDILIGAAFLVLRNYQRPVLLIMATVTIVYITVLTWTFAQLWSDPLGRLTKLIPFFALLALLACVREER